MPAGFGDGIVGGAGTPPTYLNFTGWIGRGSLLCAEEDASPCQPGLRREECEAHL